MTIQAVERFDHVSTKGNNVNAFDIMLNDSIVATVFSKNVSIKFVRAVQLVTLDRPLTMAERFQLVCMIHVVHHINNKLEGLDSVSTSCLLNAICIARMKNNDSICCHCYAAAQQEMQHGLNDNNALNLYILRNVLFTVQECRSIPLYAVYDRIESFGDVENVTQCMNYINVIKAHNNQHFAIWTKNVWLWEKAFDMLGKPENTTFVQSSMQMNKRDKKASRYVDHIFTVWENESIAAANGVTITCGGRKCLTCLRCYKFDTEFYVDELKK